MALIECPECSKSVSSTIDSCIHCGFRLKTPANRSEKPKFPQDIIPTSNSREKKQSSLRSIEALDSAAYPFVRFVLFRPIFLASIVGLLASAIWFMVWTSQLLQPQCSALYDLGSEAAATSQYGHLLGYACMPDYSGTILGGVQTITDGAIGYLKISVPPLFIGIVCELIGLSAIAFSAIAFRKLLRQFRAGNKPDTFDLWRKLLSTKPIRAISLLTLIAISLAIMVWTWPLLGPRCSVFLPVESPETKLLSASGLTHYFNFVCLPLDPSLFEAGTGLPAWLFGVSSILVTGLVIFLSVKYIRNLLRNTNPGSRDKDPASQEIAPQGKTDNVSQESTSPRKAPRKKWFLIVGVLLAACAGVIIAFLSLPHDRNLVLATGTTNTCYSDAEGKVSCWGDNSFGINDVPEDLGLVKQITLDSTVACALLENNSVRCWGGTYQGDLSYISTKPYRPWNDYFGKVKQISEQCAITEQSLVKCWDLANLLDPVIPESLGKVIQISGGAGFMCAITESGIVKCSGGNLYGEREVPSNLGQSTAVSVGGDLACAISLTKTVKCWGNNSEGQATVPSDLTNVIQIGAGYSHACALTEGGKLVCWGSIDFRTKPMQIPPDLGLVSQLSVGHGHTCVVTQKREVRCWGDNYAGQIDVPSDLKLN